MTLVNTFTSTGEKLFHHQQAMSKLRNGRGQPIVTHVMLTDVCNHTCAFCSVQARAGDSLPFDDVMAYLDILQHYGLKAVILSGGGNPILYRCKKTRKGFGAVVDAIHERGLEVGLITNGMPLRQFIQDNKCSPRNGWQTVSPRVLDKLTWVRISMSGLDHDERKVYVPDINLDKTTLGFSYVAHDVYDTPEDRHHGKVSTVSDVVQLGGSLEGRKVWRFEDRIDELTVSIYAYALLYGPRYVRLLPNCLEPNLIPYRCTQLQDMADGINLLLGKDVVFVQNKPPKAPRACYLGYIHPVLNADGYVYPCDSCVLNDAAGHQFANPWRVCRWDEVGQLYERPVRSLIEDPARTCPGCVFHQSNRLLDEVVNGTLPLTHPQKTPEHVNFI